MHPYRCGLKCPNARITIHKIMEERNGRNTVKLYLGALRPGLAGRDIRGTGEAAGHMAPIYLPTRTEIEF